MERKLRITLSVIVFSVILQYGTVFAAVICPFAPLMLPGGAPPTCGTGNTLTINATNGLCCMTVADPPGGLGEYCSTPARLPGNMNKCPTTHPYNMAKDQCCGPAPITPQEMMDATVRAAMQAAQAAAAAAAANAAGTTAGCVDKMVAGRASDCPANAALCNNTLYYQLMTDQCPLTCGRCTAATGTNAAVVGTARGNGCTDGLNAQGVSECAQNSFRCTQPIWGPFMMKECPFTCNPACKTGVTTAPTIATTQSTTTTTTVAG